jgi:predicted flap endonuclease-1-like 5' DNA nuclease
MTMDFRTRSADVRREAADILWRFRSSRAARRAGSAPEGAGDLPDSAPRPGLPVSPATEELIRAARQQPLSDLPLSTPMSGAAMATAVAWDHAADTGDGVAALALDPMSHDDAPGHFGTPADSQTVRKPGASVGSAEDETTSPRPEHPALLADGPPDGPAKAAEPGASTAPPAPTATLAPDPELPSDGGAMVSQMPGVVPGRAHDLMDLPGVGAGLVWLLGRCGVHTLDDLARADAARLEQDLGLVGQLLDLPSWIDLARQAVAIERTSAP